MHRRTFVVLFAALSAAVSSSWAADSPRSVEELWADFDPRRDPLETEIIREWKVDGMVLRSVRFLVGTFREKPARLAAFFGFPEGTAAKLPAVMHIHGGGQRASLDEVKAMVARGYAALSVNWGGREMEDAQPGDANTDWGAVDPTQQNVPGYTSMLPGPKQLFLDREHPKNNNWYLLTLGCRRGLTFLEQQPEVDAQRLGIHGYSMGGNLTMYVAGTDARVKAAVPAVGGQGWRWEKHDFLGGSAVHQPVQGDVEVFRRTLSFESYAPLIRCPILHRSATNDFHGWMDDVYRTNALIPAQPLRYAWSPHFNHRLTPEVAITMPLWLDHFLQGKPPLPEAPTSTLTLDASGGIPEFRVKPDGALPTARCEVYFSVDPDPRARYWRSAEVVRDGKTFRANLPLDAAATRLFVFANVFHVLPQPASLRLPGLPKQIAEVCLSTQLHRVSEAELEAAKVARTAGPNLVLDDFRHGWRDWYSLNEGHKALWQRWTRKLTDPHWRGPRGAGLAVTLTMPASNKLTFVLIENEWRNYRGAKRTFVCEREVPGSGTPQTVVLRAEDFRDEKGEALAGWNHADLLGICAHFAERSSPAAADEWNGALPDFHRLEWQPTPDSSRL